MVGVLGLGSGSRERPREAQGGPERFRENTRETQFGPDNTESTREAQKRPREAQRGPEGALVASGHMSLHLIIKVIQFAYFLETQSTRKSQLKPKGTQGGPESARVELFAYSSE